MQTSRRSATLRLAELETRENPSGTVNALMLGGVLALTGDDNDNQITSITIVGGATPSVTITPDAGTTIDNLGAPGGGTVGAPVTIPGLLGSIRVRLAGGNDVLAIDPTADFSLVGSVTIDMGDGDNVLGLQTSGKLGAASLNVSAGDGQDTLNIGGGTLVPNTITGDVTISMGVGRGDQNNPDGTVSLATVSRLNVQGVNGFRVTALEGDERIRLIGTSVKNALRGDGGVGIFDVGTLGGTIGSIVLNSAGVSPGVAEFGASLALGGTTVSRTVSVSSQSGVNLEFNTGTSGDVTLSSGSAGQLIATFLGNSTINGNLKAKGYHSQMQFDERAKLTVNGNLSISGLTGAALSISEAELAVNNLDVTSDDGNAEVSLFDSVAGTSDKLTVNGTLTLRGDSARYTQNGGTASILSQMAITAIVDTAEFVSDIGTNYFDAPGAITTIVNGLLSIAGPNASASVTESELTTATGVVIQGQATASYSTRPSVQAEDPVNAGVFSKARGGKTTVQRGGMTIRSAGFANFTQTEGISSIPGGISVTSLKKMATVQMLTGDGIDAVGPQLTIGGGSLLAQGANASWIQSGGQVSIAKGVKLTGTNGVQFVTAQGETHDRDFNFRDLPATTNITTSFQATGGAGEAQFQAGGGALNVGGDVSISGKLQNRLRFGGATGTTIGGNLNVLGATGESDWFIADTNLTVNKNTSINLGTGTNAITLGSNSGAILFKGNLSLVTGDGADQIVLNKVNVLGNTTITTGAGADLVTIIGNSTFTGTTAINTGLGDDRLEIANDTASTGPVTFTGLATFKTGDGNDTLSLGRALSAGGTANTKALFGAAGSTVKGELNLNRFDDELSQFDPANLTISGFVDPTP